MGMSLVACLFALLPRQIDIPLAYSVNGLWQPLTVQGAGFLPSKLTITGSIDSAWQLLVENTSPNPVGVWFGDSPIYDNDAECFARISLRAPGATILEASVALPTTAIRLAPFDGAMNFGGPSGVTSPWIRTQSEVSVTITDPDVLAMFAGDGPVQLECERFGWHYFASSNLGNFFEGAMNKTAASLEFVFES